MIETRPSQTTQLPASPRLLPILLVLFIGSGGAALIYEIIWFQLLQLVIGSSAVSLGVLLGTFMGGMCLGSLVLPRLVSSRHHPLRVYGLLELGIGICGLLVLFGMPLISRFYIANAGQGFSGILLRGLVCAACLLAPTLLMGATLPAIGRWIETTPQGVSWLGFFYGGNIAGAVGGCLLAGFYLLRVHDMAIATYVAVAINVFVALVNLVLAAWKPHQPPEETIEPSRATAGSGAWMVYVTIALSGLSALGAEVIWTRLLSLMLGATVYTFSIILAVFLVGLGVGSSVGSILGRESRRPRFALGVCQALLCAAIAWTAYSLAKSLPYWPINPSLSTNPWIKFQLDLMRCLWAILPAACLWGASFPLALASVAVRGQDPGKLIGGVYAANTMGAIVGAIGFSVLLIRWVGTQQAQRLLIVVSGLSSLIMLVPMLLPRPGHDGLNHESRPARGPLAGVAALIVIIGLMAALVSSVARIPGSVVAYGRHLATQTEAFDILYMGEGMNASIAVSQMENGVRNFHVSGKVEASSEPQDMRLQRMLGHISALFHSKPVSVLVVGCGAGVTAGSFVLHPDVKRIVICELEPLITQMADKYFSEENYHVVGNPKVQIVYDDARHYVLTTPEKFDIITSDPIHPWVKGSATLYSKEYFEMCKRHLNPGGVITQWVPLYESDLKTVKSEFATFFEVFPEGTIWNNDVNGKGYDVVLLGQAGPTRIDVDAMQQRLDREDHQAVAKSLNDVGFTSAVDLLATYAGRAKDLGALLKNAEINRDRNLRLQYLAGMGLDSNKGEAIVDDLLSRRKFSEDLFVTSGPQQRALKKKLEGTKPGL